MVKCILVAAPLFALLMPIVVSERMSDTKCADYSAIPRPPNGEALPHIVWIRKNDNANLNLGTLISDTFVLTTADLAQGLIVFESQVYFVPEEQYTIVEKILHPDFGNRNNHNIALLRIELKIDLDSLHRPACLWTQKYFESTQAELLHHCNECGNYEKESFRIVKGDMCYNYMQEYLSNSSTHMCVQRDNNFGSNFEPTKGSPIQAYRPEEYLSDNYFIYGLLSYSTRTNDSFRAAGIKIYNYLDWIESIVWPKYKPITIKKPIAHKGSTIEVNAVRRYNNSRCGRIQSILKPFITLSMPTVIGEFPWHSAIFRSKKRGDREYICGGSLLNENTIVTAGHCVFTDTGLIPSDLLVAALGKYDLDTVNSYTRESRADRVILHNNFTREYFENDIALIKLKISIVFSSYIQPVCITNDPGIFPDNVGVTTGWGRNEQGFEEGVLTKASLPIKTDTECKESNPVVFPMILNENNFCAGYRNGTSVCSGDSGGGLVFKRDDQWYVRGIVSAGVNLGDSCDANQFVIFTDVTKYFDWILDNMM